MRKKHRIKLPDAIIAATAVVNDQILITRESHFGKPAPTEDRDVVDHSYTYSLMLIFNSKEDQDAYQVHSIHQEFVEKNQHLWEKVKVYDTVDI